MVEAMKANSEDPEENKPSGLARREIRTRPPCGTKFSATGDRDPGKESPNASRQLLVLDAGLPHRRTALRQGSSKSRPIGLVDHAIAALIHLSIVP
jgi:hypothetical protein